MAVPPLSTLLVLLCVFSSLIIQPNSGGLTDHVFKRQLASIGENQPKQLLGASGTSYFRFSLAHAPTPIAPQTAATVDPKSLLAKEKLNSRCISSFKFMKVKLMQTAVDQNSDPYLSFMMNANTLYYTNAYVGANGQKMKLLLDTTSSVTFQLLHSS